MIRKSERALTNIEYEELKKVIEENKNKYFDVEIISLLDRLKDMDQEDVYVKDLVNLVFELLFDNYKNDIIDKYKLEFPSLEDRVENTGERKTERLEIIKKIGLYVAMGGNNEKYIDDLLSPIADEINEWDERRLSPKLTDFCERNINTISEDFLFKYYNYINFSNLIYSRDITLPESILDKIITDKKDRILLSEIIGRTKVSEELILKHKSLIFNDERCLSSMFYNRTLDLSVDFIVELITRARRLVDGDTIVRFLSYQGNKLSDEHFDQLFELYDYQDFSFRYFKITKKAEDYIVNQKKFWDDFSKNKFWENVVSLNPMIDEEFIEKNKDDLNIVSVLEKNQNLTEEFIEKHLNKMTGEAWVNISENADLSEEFIWRHKDKVSWERISRYQKLSIEFILGEGVNYLNLYYLEFNEKIDYKKITKKQLRKLFTSMVVRK